MEKDLKKNICVLDYAFQRIGGKYKGRILLCLYNNRICRYGELSRHLSDISTKMLTQTLRELENDNFVHRKTFNEVPPKVEYSLTEDGKELIPFLQYLVQWGTKQIEKNDRITF